MSLENYNKYSIVDGTAYADYIYNYAGGATIYGYGGDDYIYNSTNSNYTINGSWGYVTIDGGAGADTIKSVDPYVSIVGGASNDLISVYSSSSYHHITINGGTGNDSIYGNSLTGDLYQFRAGDGDDTIYGYNSSDTISIVGGGLYSRSTVNGNVVVSLHGGDGGAMTLSGASDKTVNIVGGTLVNAWENYTKYGYVYGYSSADVIYNRAGGAKIYGYGGDDYIYNSTHSNYTINGNYGYVTIDGGSGNDSIVSYDPYVSIFGGAGNDSISLGSWNYITINGGTGNDVIYGSTSTSHLYQFYYGDGYDTIYNWSSNDTLNLGGAHYKRSTLNGSVVVSLQSGAVTLSGASGKTVNITNGIEDKGVTLNSTLSSRTLYGSDDVDSITNSGSTVKVYTYAGNDVITNSGYNVTIDGGSGNDTIKTSYSNYGFFTGGANDDLVSLYSAWYTTVDGGDGNDKILVPYRAHNNSINGGAGNDTISLVGSQNGNDSATNLTTTVRGGTGNDVIYSDTLGNGLLYQVYSGDGYDTIYNWSNKDTLNLGGAYYTRSTVNGNVVVSLTSGYYGAITLSGASGKTVNIVGGTLVSNGIDVKNYTKYSVVSGANSADTIRNYAGGAKLYGYGGNDYIYNSTNSSYTVNGGWGYVTIDGGDGADTIYSYDPRVSINGGAGNDSISLYGSSFGQITVKGGAGSDTIYGNGGGILYQYSSGDGSDLIYNFGSNDTLSISGSSTDWTTQTGGSNGSDVYVNITGSGTITLSGAAGKTLNIVPKRTKGISISNYTKYATVNGTSYGDTINNYAGGAKLYGSGGNDTIYNSTGLSYTINSGYGYVTIDGGAGNDTIKSIDPRTSIFGGAGADLISLSSSGWSSNTVNGGKGNDIIYGDSGGGGVLYQYSSGDGSDVIYGYNSKDSITISGGASWSTVNSGNNVLVKIANSGTISLMGAKGKTINVYPATTPTTPTTPTNPTVASNVSQQDVIKKFMKSLDTTTSAGVAALNQAVCDATGGYFQNINAAINQMVADCQRANNATTFLRDYCGIDLSNDDTGAITGYDASGSSYQKTASDIVPESGSVDNYTDNAFTTNGLRVHLSRFDSNVNPTTTSYSSLTNGVQKYIWQAAKTWWIPNSLSLISQSYGNNYSFSSSSSSTVKDIYFGFVNESYSSALATTCNWSNYSGKVTQLAMTVNMKYYNGISIGNVDGQSSSTTAYLDRTLAHEFTHAVMAANINYFNDLPQFIKEGMAELTHGIDDERTYNIKSLAGNYSSLDSALNLSNRETGTVNAYAGGYMFLRYLAKQGSEHYTTSTAAGRMASSKSVSNDSGNGSTGVSVKSALLTVTKDFIDDMLDLTSYSSAVKKVDATILSNDVMIIGNRNNNSISAGKGNDQIYANVGNDTVLGGAGNDVLNGEAGNDKLNGGAGNDSLNGGTGDDTLTGGGGKDVFIFGRDSDNDVITDYTAGQDKIKISDGTIANIKISGKNVVLTDGNSTITVNNAKGKVISMIDSNGKSFDTLVGGKTLTVKNSSKKTLTLGKTYSNATGSKRTKAFKLTGNAWDNSITGGTKNDTLLGGAGNDSINGGKGKDKLTGGSGNDSLLGGSGKDKLYGNAGDDTLIGGAGNDSLWGNAGDDTFIYGKGDGKDVIFGFETGDLLQITGVFTTSYNKSKKEIAFKVGDGSVTLRDFGSTTTFHVNDDIYKLSGSKLTKK